MNRKYSPIDHNVISIFIEPLFLNELSNIYAYELIQDICKNNTLSQLGSNWFSNSNIIVMTSFALHIDRYIKEVTA